MSDERKAAITTGRTEATAVREYLAALETRRPKPGCRASAEMLAERRFDIDAQVAAGQTKPIERPELMQRR